jgi:hypothetical protein
VEGILQALEQLNPIADNVEYTYIDFLVQFEEQFVDSTKQKIAQATLDQLKFWFPHINQYISDFETLTRKAGYSIESRELMNFFLKGLNNAPDIVDQVIDKSPTDYYDLKAKTIMVVKNGQLLHTMKSDTNVPVFQRLPQCFDNHHPFPPCLNLSNAPPLMNNLTIPMDLSRGQFPPN